MAGAFSKVQPGDPLRIRAETWNGCIDAAIAERARQTGYRASRRGELLGDTGIIRARNSIQAILGDVPRYGVVELRASLRTPDARDRFSERALMDASVPDADTQDAVGVVLTPYPEDSGLMEVIASGVVSVRVRRDSSGHRGVSPITGDFTQFRSSAEAVAGRILWVDPAGPDGSTVWAIVRLGRDIAERGRARVVSSVADGTNRWKYTLQPVKKAAAGYGGWSNDGATIEARNGVEDGNDGTGIEGNGVDIDGSDYPSGFTPVPIGAGAIVDYWTETFDVGSVETVEYWFSKANADDGTCS